MPLDDNDDDDGEIDSDMPEGLETVVISDNRADSADTICLQEDEDEDIGEDIDRVHDHVAVMSTGPQSFTYHEPTSSHAHNITDHQAWLEACFEDGKPLDSYDDTGEADISTTTRTLDIQNLRKACWRFVSVGQQYDPKVVRYFLDLNSTLILALH